VLDQVALAGAVLAGVGEQAANHVELVVPREDLVPLHLLRLGVLSLHHLRVVLQDVGEPGRRQDALPQVVRLESSGVRRVARPIVVALVER
jgi:hypothetical protein